MNEPQIAFIGGGNMAHAIVAGLLDDGYPAAAIRIAEPSKSRRTELAAAFAGVAVLADNALAAAAADCVVLAVKPQVLTAVCTALAPTLLRTRPLIVSIAAGPRVADIDTWLGGGHRIIRVMPNQPALLRAGVSGLYANAACDAEARTLATRIVAAVGSVVEVCEEAAIDAVTAVSGSGPAYFYLLIELLIDGGIELGLGRETAERLAVGTALGATRLAHEAGEPMSALIARVRSPGGTTAAALDSLEGDGIRAIVSAALSAARDRASELGDAAHTAGRD